MARKVRIIKPPDDLRRRAVNTTRGLNLDLTPAEISKIETAVHRSKDRFVQEVALRLKMMRGAHEEAVQRPELRTRLIAHFRDESLSIKGLGGTYGFPLVTTIAASLNDFVMNRAALDDRQMVVVKLHIDTIYVLLARQAAKLKPETEGELMASFKILTARFA